MHRKYRHSTISLQPFPRQAQSCLRVKPAAHFESGNGIRPGTPPLAEQSFHLSKAGRPPTHAGFDVIGDNYVHPVGWLGELKLYPERVAHCNIGDQLVIEALDQSYVAPSKAVASAQPGHHLE